MADDLGFSDIGCFGSEIETPHLDALGQSGLRMTQMYNCARCCPSRASLLTGVYPHQAGIGHMASNDSEVGGSAYQGYLRESIPTVAEVFRTEGYQTYMLGKWHVGGEYPPHLIPEHAGDPQHPLPVQRGFDQHYGTLGGAGSYYDPPSLVQDETLLPSTPDDYYYTDAINDRACEAIRQASSSNTEENKPFFMYVAHLCPHWPLHAPPEVIKKYRGRYKAGWDHLREERFQSLKRLGMLQPTWECSPRHEKVPSWDDAPHKDWEDARMATYAAMIDVMDQGIGRIIQTLKDVNEFDNTIILFLSDNGGCAEFLKEDNVGAWCENYATVASDGTQTVVGNDPKRMPGGRDSFMSYDLPWANVSNSPFRLFKSWVHEGGIATPFLVHYPNHISNPGRIHHSPWIMLDIMATCLDLCHIPYPLTWKGTTIPPLEGKSFASVFQDNDIERPEPMFWEHQGNCAVRKENWKLVKNHGHDWELFNMDEDRTELHNLATEEPKRVQEMMTLWKEWATRCGVKEWPLYPDEEDWSNRPWDW
eukprot:scaffold89188_cov53-Attheya_sp.AAC.7